METSAQRPEFADEPSATRRRPSGEVSGRRRCLGLPSIDAKDARMILLSHPTGNEFVRAALDAFDRAGMLGEFWTTLSWNSKSPINLALPRRLREILQRRSFPATIRARTRTIPRREMIRLFAGTAGLASIHENGPFIIDAVLPDLDCKVADQL